MSDRNDRFLGTALKQAREVCGNRNFHGEVSVRLRVQGGVVQSGEFVTEKRMSRDGNQILIEKSKLPD